MGNSPTDWKVMTCSSTKGYEGTAADTWSIAVCLVELLCGLGTVESASESAKWGLWESGGTAA